MPPQWNSLRFRGHVSESQAIFIGMAALVFALLFSLSVVGMIVWQIAEALGYL